MVDFFLGGEVIMDYIIVCYIGKVFMYLLFKLFFLLFIVYMFVRRVVIDLIGWGFIFWELYMDVLVVFIVLLEFFVDSKNCDFIFRKGLLLFLLVDIYCFVRYVFLFIVMVWLVVFIVIIVKEVKWK